LWILLGDLLEEEMLVYEDFKCGKMLYEKILAPFLCEEPEE